jgi:acetyl-CoA C-acetyltransferase
MVYILSGARTASGSFLGPLSKLTAPELGAVAISGCLKRAPYLQDHLQDIGEVVMGQVVQAGSGQAPARQAALKAGLLESTPCVTVNKVCGSGLQAILQVASAIKNGDYDLGVAGGMESMSQAPFLFPQGRTGVKFGHASFIDSLMNDGLTDAVSKESMGVYGELCAKKYEFSREAQDQFAIESFKRAQKAISEGHFAAEIEPVIVKEKQGDVSIAIDDGPGKAVFSKIPTLKPAFDKNGTITAANASTLNDGAAALILGGEKYADQAEFEIVAFARHAQEPSWFTTAPVSAMKKNLQLANLSIKDIDVFEINEAFAVVPMAAIKELGLNPERVNIFGGGISLGHPIGCSGARIVVTLMTALKKVQGKYGLASLCIGGGEALSIIIKRR